MGQLHHNYFDNNLLHAYVCSVGFRTSYPSFIGQLFDCKTPAFDTWKKEDWICQSCLTVLIRSHLHVWLLEYKQQRKLSPCFLVLDNTPTKHSMGFIEGLQIDEDCWYIGCHF